MVTPAAGSVLTSATVITTIQATCGALWFGPAHGKGWKRGAERDGKPLQPGRGRDPAARLTAARDRPQRTWSGSAPRLPPLGPGRPGDVRRARLLLADQGGDSHRRALRRVPGHGRAGEATRGVAGGDGTGDRPCRRARSPIGGKSDL